MTQYFRKKVWRMKGGSVEEPQLHPLRVNEYDNKNRLNDHENLIALY